MNRLLAILLLFSIVITAAVEPVAAKDTAETVVTDLSTDITNLFDQFNRQVIETIKTLSAQDTSEEKIRLLLRKIYMLNTATLNCAFVNDKGAIVFMEPAAYKNLEGKGIAEQQQLQTVIKTGRPTIGAIFHTNEDVFAQCFQYPVDRAGAVIGVVRVLVRPEVFAANAFERASGRKQGEVWAIDPSGNIVYTTDYGDMGRNIFSDPSFKPYPDLISICHRIAKEKNGNGSFSFLLNGTTVTKSASWNTVSSYGMEWRVVVSRVMK